LFEALVEELADRDLVALARERLALKETAPKADLDQL
jgi:antitoxin StbD